MSPWLYRRPSKVLLPNFHRAISSWIFNHLHHNSQTLYIPIDPQTLSFQIPFKLPSPPAVFATNSLFSSHGSCDELGPSHSPSRRKFITRSAWLNVARQHRLSKQNSGDPGGPGENSRWGPTMPWWREWRETEGDEETVVCRGVPRPISARQSAAVRLQSVVTESSSQASKRSLRSKKEGPRWWVTTRGAWPCCWSWRSWHVVSSPLPPLPLTAAVTAITCARSPSPLAHSDVRCRPSPTTDSGCACSLLLLCIRETRAAFSQAYFALSTSRASLREATTSPSRGFHRRYHMLRRVWHNGGYGRGVFCGQSRRTCDRSGTRSDPRHSHFRKKLEFLANCFRMAAVGSGFRAASFRVAERMALVTLRFAVET